MTTPFTTTPAYSLYTGTDPEKGVELRMWKWPNGSHTVAMRDIGSLDSWPAPVELALYADVETDEPAPNDWAAGWGK